MNLLFDLNKKLILVDLPRFRLMFFKFRSICRIVSVEIMSLIFTGVDSLFNRLLFALGSLLRASILLVDS